MKNVKYSVSLLRESKIKECKVEDSIKFFEEVVIVFEESEDFFENSEEFLIEYFNKNIGVLKYHNAYGEEVVDLFVKVIHHQEIFEKIVCENFTEVYSRFIIGKIEDTPEDIIKKYFDIEI